MQKIVIFDMDGTLIDSKKDITISINYVRQKHYSLAPLSEEFVVEAINMEVRNLPKMFYDTDNYEEKDRELFEVHYEKQCVQNVYLYEGIKEMLMALKTAGVKLSVATNAPTMFAKEMLTHLQVDELFDVIIGADEVTLSKPNPQMLHKILEYYAYNAKSDKAWMIGDNSKDIQSATNAKIDSFFALWGFSSHLEMEGALKTPKEVLNKVL